MKRSYGQGQSETPQDRKERRGKTTAKNLAFAAVFAALCFTGTFVIVIPLPYGYFNAGDVFVLLAGWCLGPVYGSVAAAAGSSLADVLSGFALYAPATFVIKGADALVAWAVYRAIRRLISAERLDFLPRAPCAHSFRNFVRRATARPRARAEADRFRAALRRVSVGWEMPRTVRMRGAAAYFFNG